MKIKYSDKAVKQIKKINKGDRKSLEKIIEGIEKYSDKSKKKFDIKILKRKYGNFKRMRIGNYKIIFEEQEDIMQIIEVKHRQEAYND